MECWFSFYAGARIDYKQTKKKHCIEAARLVGVPTSVGVFVLITSTMFTCQATVRKNEIDCSDVIVLSGLHV